MALPIMLANITVPLVGVVDTAVMGRMSDPAYIGATAIGATIFSSIYWIFGFLRMGTGGLVAQYVGARDVNESALTVGRGLLISAVIAVVLILLQQPIFNLSLSLFSASALLHELTAEYFYTRILSAPATLALYVVIGSLIGLQQMRSVLVVQLILNLLNVALNIAFFKLTSWGITGVALATVLSEYVALVLGLALLKSKLKINASLFLNQNLWNQKRLLHVLAINANLMVRTFCLIASFYWLMIISSRFGEIVLAANTTLLQFLHVTAYGLDGFSHTAESLGGQAYGKRDKRRFILSIRLCAEWGIFFACAFTFVFAALGYHMLDLLTDMDAVVDQAAIYLPWIIVAPVFSIASFLLDGIYIGVTHTREMRDGMIISLVVFLLASWGMTQAFGNHGLWAAYIFLMIARGLTLTFWFPNILRRFHSE